MRWSNISGMKTKPNTVYTVPYAWTRKLKSFDASKPDPDETRCAWCNKSQTEILDEHIDMEDNDENKRRSN